MTVREAAEKIGLSLRAGGQGADNEVVGGIVCDLLSVVMSKAAKGDLWVTVQCHPNVVAVAVLAGLSGIVITHGFEPEPETVTKAEEEGIPLLTTSASSFEVTGRLYGLEAR